MAMYIDISIVLTCMAMLLVISVIKRESDNRECPTGIDSQK